MSQSEPDHSEGEVASNHDESEVDRVPARNVRGRDGGHRSREEGDQPGPVARRGARELDRDWTGSAGVHQEGSSAQTGPALELQQPLIGLTESYSAQLHELHAGPLPAPVSLAQYGEVDPSFPERIVCMAERQIEVRSDAIARESSAIAFVTKMGGITVVGTFVLAAVGFMLSVLLHAPWQASVAIAAVMSLPGAAQVISAAQGKKSNPED